MPDTAATSRSLRAARAVYFLYYAAWASLLPFLPLYYQSLGLTAGRIGLLTAIPPLVTLFAAPFWGGLADASGRHRQVLLTAIVGVGLAAAGLSQARGAWWLAGAIVAYAFFGCAIIPLVDHTVLALLGGRRDRYGSQRVWGAVGWGLAAPAVGWLTGAHGLEWAFAAYLVLLASCGLAAWRLPVGPAAGQQRTPFWGGARRLLANRYWLLFLATVFLNGIGQAALNNYLFLYLGGLGASRLLMGLALAVATVSELPVLAYSGPLLRRWGPRGLLTMSLAAFIVRALGYSLVDAPWQALLLQLAHGLSFSAMWVAGVSLAAESAPEGLGATAQGLFTATLMGVSGAVGALVNGALFERLGGAGMFRVDAAIVIVGLVVWVTLGVTLAKVQRPSQG